MNDSTRGLLLVSSGIVVLSFDGLLVRLAQADGWSIVFWRGLLMFLALGAFSLSAKSRASLKAQPLISAASALLLAFTSIFFVLAVIHTTVANVVVVLSTAPLFAALFTRFILGESVALHTWLAIGVAALGIMIVFAGAFTSTDLAGNSYALLSSAAVGANLTLLRRHRAIGTDAPHRARRPGGCGDRMAQGRAVGPGYDELLGAGNHGPDPDAAGHAADQ